MENPNNSNLLMIGVPQEKVTQVIQLLANAGVQVTIFPRAPLPEYAPLFSGIPGTPSSSYLRVAQASAELPAPKVVKAVPKKKATSPMPLHEFLAQHPEQSRMIKMGGKDLGISAQRSLHANVQNTIKDKTGDPASLRGVFLHRNRHHGWWGFVGFHSIEAAQDFEHYCQGMTFFHNHVRLVMGIEEYAPPEEQEEEEMEMEIEEEDGGMIEEK